MFSVFRGVALSFGAAPFSFCLLCGGQLAGLQGDWSGDEKFLKKVLVLFGKNAVPLQPCSVTSTANPADLGKGQTTTT